MTVSMHSITHPCDNQFYFKDLIQYSSLTLNSGVNSVMEGNGSVSSKKKKKLNQKSQSLIAPVCFPTTKMEEKLICDCHECRRSVREKNSKNKTKLKKTKRSL